MQIRRPSGKFAGTLPLYENARICKGLRGGWGPDFAKASSRQVAEGRNVRKCPLLSGVFKCSEMFGNVRIVLVCARFCALFFDV